MCRSSASQKTVWIVIDGQISKYKHSSIDMYYIKVSSDHQICTVHIVIQTMGCPISNQFVRMKNRPKTDSNTQPLVGL